MPVSQQLINKIPPKANEYRLFTVTERVIVCVSRLLVQGTTRSHDSIPPQIKISEMGKGVRKLQPPERYYEMAFVLRCVARLCE